MLEAVGFAREGEELRLAGNGGAAAAAVELLQPKVPELATSLRHDADVRGISLCGGLIATAALDNVARLFDKKGALVRECVGHTSPARSDPGVLAAEARPDGSLVTGARDGAMIVWAVDGSSCTRYVGHGDEIPGLQRPTNAQTVSCLCCGEEGLVISGGWDRTCIAWDTAGAAPARRYGPFGAVVNGVCLLGDEAVAACGDGTLTYFDPRAPAPDPVGSRMETYVHATLVEAQGPPMRAVAASRHGAVTTSNDGMARLWTDRRLARGARVAAENYLFAVACDELRAYVAGDDAVVTSLALPSLSVVFRIAQPGPVWALAVEGPDLAVGCEVPFGALLWTRDPKRRAPAFVADNIRNVCDKSAETRPVPVLEGEAAKAKPVGNQQQSGGNVSLGGGGSQPSGAFDFSFPVDLGRGGELRIEWNRGDDPNEVAVDFCAKHGIPRNQVDQVIDFIKSANPGDGGGRTAASEPPPDVQADMVAQVMAMGVNEQRAREALQKARWASIEAAIGFLF